MVATRQLLLLLAPLAVLPTGFATQRAEAAATANPIRKVVNLLQAMQKKVTAEGEKSEELYEKFLCYCKKSGDSLSASISAAEAKVPELASAIEAAKSKKAQLEGALKSHFKDRDGAKGAMAEASALRSKEKAAFDKELAESKTNLKALKKAIAAISQGLGGSFLQTESAGVLRALVGKQEMPDMDRQEVLSFLSEQGSEHAPTLEILGILKQMGDEMLASQKECIATEEAAVKEHEALMGAKTKEVAALSKSIEQKLGRVGNLGIEIATMQNDAGDTAEALEGDKKFVANLKANCAKKAATQEEEKKARAAEIVALADTIKTLNDDDALEIFKKTLPSASASFVQLQETSSARRAEATEVLTQGRFKAGQSGHRIDFILLALRGRKVGFAKVLKLIDGLVATLQSEQADDEQKKEYCAVQLDQVGDKRGSLRRSISDLGTVIEESKEGIATLTEEIAALQAGVTALDKAVSEATAQRQAESAEYKELLSTNKAAKELILFAKNRLQKFYNPKLYRAPAASELSREDRIYENEGGEIPAEAPGGIAGTGITAFTQVALRKSAPPPPPETAAAYTKKSEESAGVMAMMDLLVKDLDKETTVASTEEANAKEEYEQTIADSAEKRRQDSKSLTDKEAAKADLESALDSSKKEKKSTAKELMGVEKYTAMLHSDCDWLLQYFDVRKQARAEEVDALQKAKAVLSGADYSLLQQSAGARVRKFMRRA